MPVIQKTIAYNFSAGAQEKIMQEPFQLNGNTQTSFCLQVIFTALANTPIATVYLMASNDGTNFQRVPEHEFNVSGTTVLGYFIYGSESLAKAKYMQLGVTGVSGDGQIIAVFIAY